MNNNASATLHQPTQSSRIYPRSAWMAGVMGSVILFVLLAAGVMTIYMNYVPGDLDTSTTLPSAQRLYRIGYTSELDPVPINQIQRWVLHVEAPDGQPISGARISVDGDMPQHGHGLPTRPQVTADLGNGDYQVEGLRFHMPGWWVVDFTVEHGDHVDTVRFNLLLK